MDIKDLYNKLTNIKSKCIEVEETLTTNLLQPLFGETVDNHYNYISRLRVGFNSSIFQTIFVSLKINHVLVEQHKYVGIGDAVISFNTFKHTPYPNKRYRGISIEFTCDKVPPEYKIIYCVHNFPKVVDWAIKIMSPFLKIKHNQQLYLQFLEEAVVSHGLKDNRYIKFLPIDLETYTFIESHDLDKVVQTKEFSYLNDCLYPPDLGKNKRFVSVEDQKISQIPFYIAIPIKTAELDLKTLQENFPQFKFKINKNPELADLPNECSHMIKLYLQEV